LSSERRELQKRKQELEQAAYNLENKKSDLDNDKDKLANLPSEEILTEIKRIQSDLTDKRGKLELISSQIDLKSDHVRSQSVRIKRFTDNIEAHRKKKTLAEEELKKYPSKQKLKILQELHSKVLSYENQITLAINYLPINLDFDPLSDPTCIYQKISGIEKEIEILKHSEREAIEGYEFLERLLTSNEVLSDIKKNSVKYIEDKNNCPVCNKPIDNKEAMISTVNEEIKSIDESCGPLTTHIHEAKEKMKKAREQIESNNNLKTMLNSLEPSINGLVKDREHIHRLIEELGAKDQNNLVSGFGFDSVEQIIGRIQDLELNINNYRDQIEEEEEQIKTENDQYGTEIHVLCEYEDKRNKLEKELTKTESILTEYIHTLPVDNLDILVNEHDCKNIDELMTKRQTLEKLVEEKTNSLNTFKRSKFILEEDVKTREQTIRNIEEKESQMHKKENYLRHAKYLRGEIDGFISNYIVEGKMAKIIMQATNAYLAPFTGGRYKINRISPTVRRTKGMESHGLEIILMDSMDNMLKTKEQMSGGDATSLGLALRIAISKLMARIRPFKEAERRPPLINSIIMDEPLASLDSSRRHTLMNMLTQDKSFSQIFLITHTESEFGDCHSIMIDEDGNGRRQITYRPIKLQ
jgi:DNA repair exonuclease SbcCD ATPase subunit